MKLSPKQKAILGTAVSEALAFRVDVAVRSAAGAERPTMLELEGRLAALRELSATLMRSDAVHRAIVDRCVDAIEEGLLSE